MLHTGSHSVSFSPSHCAWQSSAQVCAHDERHSPWSFTPSQAAVQSCMSCMSCNSRGSARPC